MLNDKIVQLKSKLMTEAGIVESMIEKSITGLIEKNKETLDEVILKEEKEVNDLEIEIDELCTNIIALNQPEAKDLRTVLMILKMNNDLERMGDSAVNISESAEKLIDLPLIKPLKDIPKMSEETINMVKNSILSFLNEDISLAKWVCINDNKVDDLRDKILKELLAVMQKETDQKKIEGAFHLIRIAQNLERIADLSTNICEESVYIANGKVMKHHKGD
jgi:phosphate transport system protein